MSSEKEHKEEIQKERLHQVLMDQRKVHLDREFYANQRFDTILVVLGAGGVGFNSELYSDATINKVPLILSLGCFIAAVISNLIGQYFSRMRHRSDEQHTLQEIYKNSDLAFEEVKEQKWLNYAIRYCDLISLCTFCCGLIALLLALVARGG